jgi:AraC-like DNA-binding protein
MLSHLRVVAGDAHTVLAVPTWGSVRTVLRARPVDIMVVDPCIDGSAHTEPVRSLRADFPSVGVLIYTGISAESTRAMLALGEYGVRHCVLRGFDDEPGRFRERIELLRAVGLEDRVLGTVRVALESGQVPAALISAVEELFHTPRRFRTAEDVAKAAGMPRRGVNRWLERAGLAPARTLVMAARVLRGYQYAQNPALAASDIALRLGYPDPRVFASHVRLLTGRRVSTWRTSVSPDQCVSILVSKLMLAPSRASALRPPLTLMRRAAGR